MADNNQQPPPTTTYLHHLLTPPSPEKPDTAGGPIRRSRGRPPGSKNKPKPPLIITREAPNSLRSHIFEITAGADIIETLYTFARRRGRGLSILSGTGVVSDVTLRQPMDGLKTPVTVHGRFEIINLSGTVLPAPAPENASGLSVFVSGGEGEVVGGVPAGPLVGLSSVVVVAVSFANAVFERLPVDDDDDDDGGGDGGQGDGQPTVSQCSEVTSGGGGGVNVFNTAAAAAVVAGKNDGDGGGGGEYHFSGDVMGWGSNSRRHY
ncbi:hypothetical protein QVD17_08005 [Tagetes erecta]|uniref:PPC domain-containing protein n=1 Tax=Tagetes erecta TaxID=13708 RepID=A0AAD8L5C1_TARER|nr:hypothetical protein QVD17_08005 [Tagetes erecta]